MGRQAFTNYLLAFTIKPMALFQKRPDVASHLPVYTLGMNRTLLIVGLGNVGKQYDGTRHNIGFAAVDTLAEKLSFDPWINKKDLKCMVTTATVGDAKVMLVKPTTFMNLSGEAVQAIAHFYKIAHDQIVVVHDEIDIPFGQIRTRMGGGSAGHNGIKSVSQHLGEEYGRIRVGIGQGTGNREQGTDKFVLDAFTKEEQAHIPALLKETTAILSEYIYGAGLQTDTRNFLL